MTDLYWSRLTVGRIACALHKGFSDHEKLSAADYRGFETIDFTPECEDCGVKH